MRKFILFFLFAFCAISLSFAQLNPVNNLEWDHWYVMPNNYFILSWDLPDPSSDTLVGFNVYREDQVYCFITETSLYHTEYASNCGEDFLIYGSGWGFYTHVTAVYNSTLEESDYLESVFVNGYLIDIAEKETNTPNLFPNPTPGKIRFESGQVKNRILLDGTGKVLKQFLDQETMDISSFSKGLYYIRFVYKDKSFTKTVLLQ